jgi:hypothetical protein
MERSHLNSLVTSTSYSHNGTKTVCILVARGRTIVGESRCKHTGDYNKSIGETIARENAYKKLDELETYYQNCKSKETN